MPSNHILSLPGDLRAEKLYRDHVLGHVRLFPTDSQIEPFLTELKKLEWYPEDTRLLVQSTAFPMGLQFAHPREGWGYVVESDGAALIGLHNVFLEGAIGFLADYLANGEIWPPYADFGLINPEAGEGGPSTVFEIHVEKSAPVRVGDISKMFD